MEKEKERRTIMAKKFKYSNHYGLGPFSLRVFRKEEMRGWILYYRTTSLARWFVDYSYMRKVAKPRFSFRIGKMVTEWWA